MTYPKRVKLLFVASLCVAACLIGTATVQGVCTQIAVTSQTPACSCCVCQGPCVCVPTTPWGYHARQWRPWPGGQYRQDIVFPQSIGIERVAAPRGERPKPLPREQYVKQKTKAEQEAEERTNIQILEGAPLEPAGIAVPFDYSLEPDQELPDPNLDQPNPSAK